jgi:pyrimidine-nucleoside phosphorylase
VNECVAYLRRGPQDAPVDPRLHELTMELATEMFLLSQKGKKTNAGAVREMLEEALASGKAYSKFLEIVSLQGGDTEALDQGLKVSSKTFPFLAKKKGAISAMDGESIGWALTELGGGRKQSSDKVDPSVGFVFEKAVGEAVSKGDVIAQVYAKDSKSAALALEMLERAVEISSEPLKKPDLIRARI